MRKYEPLMINGYEILAATDVDTCCLVFGTGKPLPFLQPDQAYDEKEVLGRLVNRIASDWVGYSSSIVYVSPHIYDLLNPILAKQPKQPYQWEPAVL